MVLEEAMEDLVVSRSRGETVNVLVAMVGTAAVVGTVATVVTVVMGRSGTMVVTAAQLRAAAFMSPVGV